eukprot:6256781-Alexandrium_andersonii.AAC.1
MLLPIPLGQCGAPGLTSSAGAQLPWARRRARSSNAGTKVCGSAVPPPVVFTIDRPLYTWRRARELGSS